MKHLMKCGKCGNYTLKEKCYKCGQKTVLPRPAKFNLEDPYGKYRREVKAPELRKRGLL